MPPLNIAVIGSGVSGLTSAWLLSKRHQVTLYEQDDRLGGHANTVDIETLQGRIPVDTGFIVYNERTYPNLTALFRHLQVETDPTEMSFALSLQAGGYEYSGSGFGGFFGQPANLASPRHWQLLADVSRFFRTAEKRIADYPDGTSLGTFLVREGYSPVFIQDHIVPMGAAIWSTIMDDMMIFPAEAFIRFYANHGMLQFKQRPAWRTVSGGSRSYVKRLVADGNFAIERHCPVQRVVRQSRYVQIEDERGVVRPFDHVVLATHADQALALLGDADELEQAGLGAFHYQRNTAVLHRDRRLMPRRRRLWSSWNYIKRESGTEDTLCLTYWMNRLQNLGCDTNIFVTLNPPETMHPKTVDATFAYDHPVYSAEALVAQRSLWNLQGRRRTWFCGAYFGAGFHEDGAQSGLSVAEQLGGTRRPWTVENESGRIHVTDPRPEPVPFEAAE